MMLLLLAFPVFLVFLAVGFVSRSWSFVTATVLICTGVALFLWINDGWYGAGWGDSGILFNVLAALLAILGVTIGVAVGRMKESGR